MSNPGLIEWVAKQHEGQLVRLIGEPYLNHLIRVAEMAGPCAALAYECGLCHDLFEKTAVSPASLKSRLQQCGYRETEVETIEAVVAELTDFYTKAAYPALKKSIRKEMEEQRLITISATAQTVKYADLYDNAQWMLQHQPGKAPDYLRRKKALIAGMTAGNAALRAFVINYINTKLP